MKRSTPKDRHLGSQIMHYRKKHGWSQAELAAQMQLHGCDLTTGMIGKIEIGYRELSIYEIDKFVEVFHITYDELFTQNSNS